MQRKSSVSRNAPLPYYQPYDYQPYVYTRAPRASRRISPVIYIAIFILLLIFLFPTIFLTKTTTPPPNEHGTRDTHYSVVVPPSISADFIDQVLKHYDSPASGKGQALYDGGVKYGIDPAYALAFFLQESSFGTKGVATTTHSLGNIRAKAGQPEYKGYRMYASWEEGFEDWYKLIAQQYVGHWGLTTVDKIIPVYAPAEDQNDVSQYIRSVKWAVDTWRQGQVEITG